MDSGASKHIVNSNESLIEIESVKRNLSGVFGDSVVVSQKGSIELTGERDFKIENALFHPKAKLNL